MPKLIDICDKINMGQSPDSSSYNKEADGLPFFQGNADFGKVHPIARVWCNAPKKIAYPNDILISVRAPIGALNIADQECCIGRGLAAISVDNTVCDRMYLWYALQNKANELNSKGTGSTFKAITKVALYDTEVQLPSLEQQRFIACRLSNVQDSIDICKTIIEKLDLSVKSRFIEQFGDEKNRMVMSDVCSIITDGTHQPPKFKNEGIPFIFVSNITGDKVTYEADKFIDQDTYDELIKRTPIEIGDILLSTVGSYGHPAVVKSDKKFLFQRHIAYLKPRREIIDSDYLHGAILSPGVQEQIERGVKGIAQKTLNLSEIKKMVIPVPIMDKQRQFSSFVARTDKSKYAVESLLNKLTILRASLMQEYFG